MPARRALVTVATLVLLLAALPRPAAAAPDGDAQPAEPRPAHGESTLTATGSARVSRPPDYVDVDLGVVAYDTAVGPAHAKATEAAARAVEALKALRLAGGEIQTGAVELTPKYESYGEKDKAPILVSCQATVLLRVRTTDLTAPPRIIDAALGAGCNRVDAVRFGITRAIEAREEAVRLAVGAARRKAAVMAAALDLRIDRVLSASTEARSYGGWSFGGQISQMAGRGGGGGGDGDGGEAGSAVVPGAVEVWAEATVTFAAAPAAASPAPTPGR